MNTIQVKRYTMKKSLLTFALIGAALCTPGVNAQTGGLFGGDLPAQAQKNIESNALGLHGSSTMTSLEDLAEYFTEDELEVLLSGAVARLSLLPDGSFVASARDGGTLNSFKLGRNKVKLEELSVRDGEWSYGHGQYEPAKKALKVSLTVASSGREIDVSCVNKFAKSEQAITFYVGPLRGLNCVGVEEAIEPAQEGERLASLR